jgi:predicted phage terminase large subunit-like protein
MSSLRDKISQGLISTYTEDIDFLQYLPRVSPPSWDFNYEHFRLISEHLDGVTNGEIDRLMISMPPRHGKSTTVTVRYPVFRFERDPTNWTLITGYNERIARKFSRQSRNICSNRMPLSATKQAAEEWETAYGGGMVARGVGNPPTGIGFNLLIVDDPIKTRQEAESETYRDKLWDWYTDDLITRLEPGGSIIMIGTRYHHDDLHARALASEPGKWTVLKLPAISEGKGDPLGRPEGAALWPDRWSAEALLRIKGIQTKKEGAYSWEAQYQQNPTPRTGDFFKVLRLVKIKANEVPKMVRLVRGWDFADSLEGDYTVGVLIGMDRDGRYYVLDVVRERYLTDERNRLVLSTAKRDGRLVRIFIPQDPGQAGKGQVFSMTRMLAGYRVISSPVTGDKQVRADPFAGQVNTGNVYLVDAPWNDGFIEELRTFPLGAFDDQVDAAADAFIRVVSGGPGVFP